LLTSTSPRLGPHGLDVQAIAARIAPGATVTAQRSRSAAVVAHAAHAGGTAHRATQPVQSGRAATVMVSTVVVMMVVVRLRRGHTVTHCSRGHRGTLEHIRCRHRSRLMMRRRMVIGGIAAGVVGCYTVMIIWLIWLRIYLHLVGAAGKQGVLFVL